MYTSVVVVTLSSLLAAPATAPQSSVWLRDYADAFNKGQREKKPLAVFFGKGDSGWDEFSSDGRLGDEARRLLKTRYVPVYVDVGAADGRKLASAFRVQSTPALVLTDASDDYIALRYSGTLAPGDLGRCLAKYGDPGRVCRLTDTDPNAEVRYYPPAAPVPAAPPMMMYPAFGGVRGFGGGGC
jgi:hypothetical protein